jgi:hypothetical protein
MVATLIAWQDRVKQNIRSRPAGSSEVATPCPRATPYPRIFQTKFAVGSHSVIWDVSGRRVTVEYRGFSRSRNPHKVIRHNEL